MGAFVGAVKAGAHAIETDIHLSKDGVVVLSHVCHESLDGDVGLTRYRMQHSNDVMVKKRK